MTDDEYVIPPRSRLFRLELLGAGTSLAESAASYMARLADEHGLTTGELVTRELTPVLNKRYLVYLAINGGTRFYENSAMVLGLGKAAAEFAAALETLTLHQGLTGATMLPWAGVFPDRGLIKASRSWCPVCYQRMRLHRQKVYDPLIWSLQAVRACPEHGTLLRETCPNCGRTARQLERDYLPGYCPHCRAWLGKEGSELEEPAADQGKEVWIAQAAGEMVAKSSAMNCGNAVRHPRVFLEEIANRLCNGSAKGLARLLQEPKSTVRGWLRGGNLPPLPSFMKVCRLTGVSPVDALADEYVLPPMVAKEENMDNHGPKAVRRKKAPFAAAKKALERAVQVSRAKPPSLRGVARETKINRRLLLEHFPALCKAVSANYLRYLHSAKRERTEKLLSEACRVAADLANQGIYPSRPEVERAAAIPYVLRNAEVRLLWSRRLFQQKND